MDCDQRLAQCYLYILECRRKHKKALAGGERRQADPPTTKAKPGENKTLGNN